MTHTFPEDVDISPGDTLEFEESFRNGETVTTRGEVTRIMPDDFWDKLIYITAEDGTRWEVRLAVPNAYYREASYTADIDDYEVNPDG